MNTSPTPTPKTDAIQFQPKPISLSIENEMLRALSRQLERELTEKNNEVARLREELEFTRKEYLAMSADLDCLQAHWMELSGIQTWGQRISKSVPDLVEAWKRAESENQNLRERIAELESGWDEEAYQRRHQNTDK